MEGSILDGFELPANVAEAGAREGVARMNLTLQDAGDGVQLMSGFQKDGIPYQFFNNVVYNPTKSAEAGYEVYDELESVKFFIDRKTIHVTEIKFLDPDRLAFNLRGEPVGGSMLEDYLRWKAGKQAPGLSLDKWDAITPTQVKTLNSENVYSVEQLAAMPRDRVAEIFGSKSPFMDLHERAGYYVNSKQMNKESEKQLIQMQELSEDNKKMREELEALKAQLLEKSDPARKTTAKRRGRPPKVESKEE